MDLGNRSDRRNVSAVYPNSINQRISRGSFIRTAGVGAAATVAVNLAAGGAAMAKKPASNGIDMYPADGFDALQAAVTEGKTIILHGAWDFLDKVLVFGLDGKDAAIIGVGASISNGSILSRTPVKMTLKDIVLSSNNEYGVNLVQSAGASITGCQILCPNQSIWPNAVASYPWYAGSDVDQTNMSGSIQIRDNVIEGLNGIFFFDSMADVVIGHNTIRETNTAIGMILPRTGSLNVDGNIVNTIWGGAVGLLLQVSDDNAPTSFHSALITHNRFIFGSTWFGIGYGRWNTQAKPSIVVMNNDLHIGNNDWGAFVMHNDCIDTVWAQNKVSGSIRRGVSVATFDSEWPFPRSHHATNNVFRGNDFSSAKLDPVADSIIDIYFYPEAAHYYFDVNADNNTVIGNGGEVVDLGIGNTVTGSKNLKRHHGPVGVASSDASAIINALKREFRRH